MPQYLDLDTWPRRQHFDFFRHYRLPFFNVCANVDVTAQVASCRRHGTSFNLAVHHHALRLVNEIEPFRYRLRGERVLIHDRIHCGTTLLLEDERFVFCYFEFHRDLDTFVDAASLEVDRMRRGDGALEPQDERDDLVHFSVLPWVSFTAFSHARRLGTEDSIPKIVFGKRIDEDGRSLLPVSVEVHHALMDGLHVGRFFEAMNDATEGE